MSSENKGLFEEILADETLTGVAEYLYDNTDVVIDRKGYAESVEVPDIDFAENYAYISEEDYNKIVEAITEQAKEVRYYEGYILLNDNATLNQIDNPEFDEYDYSDSVENACTKFQLETGVPVYLLGRSGRRVCVEDSFSSFVGYADLKEVQEKLEQEVIDRHSVKESVETLTKSDDTQYIIVGVDNDGNRKFYNVSATPHWVDDCDDATIFDDQSEAHSIFHEIDKTNFRRVFVPNFDRAALKEDLNRIQSDEEEFLVVAEQIATFLRGMNIDMDDVSGKITHYDVNMFTDCSEDRIRINWTSYMKKNVVRSNMKILPAMLTQMMKDDTRFEEVIDIFVSEVRDDVVLHNSDLGAVAVEMVASCEVPVKPIEESISVDDVVVIGIYGDEVDGFETVDQLAQSFEDNGIEVISKSGDMEFGWDLELKGNARDIYRLVNGKITGYNCATTQEFVDQYRIDESKFAKEDTIKMTADEMKDKFGTDNPDIINCGRPEEDGTIELKEPETIKENTKTGKELEVGDLFVCPETGKQFKVIDTLGNDGQTLNIKVKEFETGEESTINIGINSPWETITIVESVSEEEPYTKEMVEADLKSITYNFTNKEGELQCGFEIEKDYGVEILKQHYEIVEPSIDDKYEDVKYHISYAKPKVVKESIDSKVLEGRIEDIEYVMNNYAKGSIFIDDVKGSGVNYRVTYNDVTVDVRFYTDFSEYTYYINEHGPYCHSSYEYIVRDIMDFIDYNHLGQSDEEVDESLIKESKSAVKSILEPQVKDGKVKPFGTEQKCPRGFSFKSNNGTSGTCRYNGTDYVFAVVDGELRVMTDAEAGWNWSETIYKK